MSPIGRTAREAAADRARKSPEYARVKLERERRKMDADKDLRRARLVTRIGIVLIWIGLTWGLFGPFWKNAGWAVGLLGVIAALVALRVRAVLLDHYRE